MVFGEYDGIDILEACDLEWLFCPVSRTKKSTPQPRGSFPVDDKASLLKWTCVIVGLLHIENFRRLITVR